MAQARASTMPFVVDGPAHGSQKRGQPDSDGAGFDQSNKVARRTLADTHRAAVDSRHSAVSSERRRDDPYGRRRREDDPYSRRPRQDAPHSRQDAPPPGQPTSTAAPAPLARLNAASASSLTLKVPDWYERLKAKGRSTGNKGARYTTADVALTTLQGKIAMCKKALDTPAFAKTCDETLPLIHQAMFLDVDRSMVRNHFLLHLNAGLPVLCCDAAPWYVASDAAELFRKWAREIFTSDMFHGLTQPKFENIVRGYPGKRSADVVGHNGVVVGHWVPTQLCLVRDGVHGMAMGGIYGKAGRGVYSLVMAGGLSDSGKTKSAYENIDLGEDVLYCGTDSVTGKPSDNTQLLLDNIVTKQPVRFIRSFNAPQPYAPAIGYRYDGLYDIVDSEVWNPEVQRYRFKLVRCPGQVPLRYDGPGIRPTEEEVRQARKIKYEKQFFS